MTIIGARLLSHFGVNERAGSICSLAIFMLKRLKSRAPIAAVAFLIFCAKAAPAPETKSDLLQFLDGSAMHGRLKELEGTKGLSWEHPEAKGLIELTAAHIDYIRFAQAGSVSATPGCHFRFANGDDLYGTLTSLNQDQVGLATWFGGEVKIPRAALQSITFLSKAYKVLYEGPTDDSGWEIGRTSPAYWTYRDGAFIGTGPGALGRDVQLSGSSSIEFDLAWTTAFELLVNIYSESYEHLDYGSHSYFIELTPEQIGLQRVHAGANPSNLGNAAMPSLKDKSKIRVTIFANKEEGTVAVLVDGVLVKRWKDSNGFGGAGHGILFYVMRPGMAIKLSNILVSAWDSKFEPVGSAGVRTNNDAVSFINHDRAGGKIETLQDGKVGLVFGGRHLNVPLERITQIDFAATNAAAAAHGPGEVRAWFPGGGSLSFKLEKWDDTHIAGQSEVFGPLAFQPRSIRELEFNLDRPKETPGRVERDELEGLDE